MSSLDKIMIAVAVILTAITGYSAIRYMVVSERCANTASSTWCEARYWKE